MDIDKILKQYPQIAVEFLEEIEQYGISKKIYQKATWLEQYIAWIGFLGYPIVPPDSGERKDAEKDIMAKIKIYDNAISRYDPYTPDFIYQVSTISFQERNKLFPELYFPENTKKIKDILTMKEIKTRIIDCLSPMKEKRKTVINILSPVGVQSVYVTKSNVFDMEQFWYNAIQESHKYSSGELTCPF